MMAKVFCIIPTFNRKESIKDCIDQLLRQTYKNTEIIVVNDGSVDGTTKYLKSLDKEEIHVINGDGNFWWGKSINEGFRYIENIVGIMTLYYC